MTRRPKHSRQELHKLLMETGKSILRDEGLGTGAEGLTFKRVFDRIEAETGLRLTNASVIGRVWRNQADYQTDILADIALEGNQDELKVNIDRGRAVLLRFDRSSVEAREQALTELCRLGGIAHLEGVRASSKWPLWIGVWALAATSEPLEHRKRIETALATGYGAFTDRIAKSYLAATSYLGFRLRDPFTLSQFAVAADALGQGCGLRDRIDDSFQVALVRTTGPGGAEQEWTLFGVAFEGLVRQFFEIDPHWQLSG